jgi:ABC-type antimicrobial peptide transport system permease subunit
MGIPIVAGQDLSSISGPDLARFAVINEALARRFFPNENPIGKEVPQMKAVVPELERFPGVAQLMKEKRTIIGISQDVSSGGRVRGVGPVSFVADVENLSSPVSFAIRITGNAGELIPKVSEAIRVVEPALGTPVVQTIGQRITQFVATGLSTERALVVALNFLGGVGLLMVSVGLYGITSYRVARRTNEIGIRMALGAQRRSIVWLAQKETLRIVAAGALIGLVASIPLMLLIRRMIFGLASDDITTVIVVVALIIGVSAIATYLPARRAARVDPMLSLRVE